MKKKISSLIAFFCLFILPPVSYAEESAEIDLATGSAEVSEAMNKFLDLSVKKSLGLEENLFLEGAADSILPFYTEPFVKFNLSLSTPEEKNEKKVKETSKKNIILNGSLSFINDSENQSALISKKCKERYSQENACTEGEIYNIKDFENLNVWVQVWRKDSDQNTSANGDYLIDEFYATKPFDLHVNEQNKFTINWKIPENLKVGDYRMDFFVNSQQKFDLAGTPLTVFSSAENYNFSLLASEENAREGKVEIDKDNLKINEQKYSYRSPASLIDPLADGKIIVEFPLKNLSSTEENITLNYQLTDWGQTKSDHPIIKKDEEIKIAGGATKKIIFTFNLNDSPKENLYNLKIVAKGNEYQSASNVRFVIQGRNKGIFRFLGFAEKNNEEKKITPIFCLRNSSWEGAFKGTLALKVLNSDNKEINDWKGKLNLVSETRCFTPQNINLEKGNCYRLVGEILNDKGESVSKEETTVGCQKTEEANSSNLSSKNIIKDSGSLIGGRSLDWKIIVLILVSLSALLGILYLKKRSK